MLVSAPTDKTNKVLKHRYVFVKNMPKTKVLMLSTFIQIKQEQEQTTLDLLFRK